MTSGFDLSIVAPALLAGVLVLSTHVPLGGKVLARGIIFIDLAIAQVAGLGVILADNLDLEAHGWHSIVSRLDPAHPESTNCAD